MSWIALRFIQTKVMLTQEARQTELKLKKLILVISLLLLLIMQQVICLR